MTPQLNHPQFIHNYLLSLVITHYFIQPFEHRFLNYSSTKYECKRKYANETVLYPSDFSFIPLRDYPYQSFIQILLQNPLNHPLTLEKV